MTWGLLLASAGLAAVAAAGVLHPFGRPGSIRLESAPDALEEERAVLLRSLRDLDVEHSAGALGDEEYRTLRHETERRAVAVLRTLEARGAAAGALAAAETPSGLKELRAPSSNGHGASATRRRSRALPAVVALAVAAAVVVPLLAHAVASRGAGQAVTGDSTGPSGPSLSFFEQRVRAHPNDAAARLDLAARYTSAGLTGLAVAQYTSALRLDPSNVEAHTALGLILYGQGRAKDGLAAVEEALAVDPAYPEALYAKGLILFDADRPVAAATALRAYLAAAPFGAHRAEVQALLAKIQPSPGSSPASAPGTDLSPGLSPSPTS